MNFRWSIQIETDSFILSILASFLILSFQTIDFKVAMIFANAFFAEIQSLISHSQCQRKLEDEVDLPLVEGNGWHNHPKGKRGIDHQSSTSKQNSHMERLPNNFQYRMGVLQPVDTFENNFQT